MLPFGGNCYAEVLHIHCLWLQLRLSGDCDAGVVRIYSLLSFALVATMILTFWSFIADDYSYFLVVTVMLRSCTFIACYLLLWWQLWSLHLAHSLLITTVKFRWRLWCWGLAHSLSMTTVTFRWRLWCWGLAHRRGSHLIQGSPEKRLWFGASRKPWALLQKKNEQLRSYKNTDGPMKRRESSICLCPLVSASATSHM